MMEIGMLWFDNERKTTVPEKIARAVEFYRAKYKQAPTLCFAHPVTLGGAGMCRELSESVGLDVRTSGAILPCHFWIGVHHEGDA